MIGAQKQLCNFITCFFSAMVFPFVICQMQNIWEKHWKMATRNCRLRKTLAKTNLDFISNGFSFFFCFIVVYFLYAFLYCLLIGFHFRFRSLTRAAPSAIAFDKTLFIFFFSLNTFVLEKRIFTAQRVVKSASTACALTCALDNCCI